jgi:anion-transporting  ArsA/GET3 family ATPase
MAAVMGIAPSFDPVPAPGGFSTMVLDGTRALEEYLSLVLPGRAVLKAVFSSRFYQFFVQAAPGLRELMMLGKVYYEVTSSERGQRRWDLVILDGPASGQALSLLKMPRAARATFGSSIVGQEAENIGRLLHDRKQCAIVEVTTPETLAVSELLETQKALASIDLYPQAVILNRSATIAYDAAAISEFVRAESSRRLAHLGQLTEIARGELARASSTPKAHSRLARATRTPVMEVPELNDRYGEKLLSHLASFFASRLNNNRARHGAARE